MNPVPAWLRRRADEDSSKPWMAGVDARHSGAIQVGDHGVQVNRQVTVQLPSPSVVQWPMVEGDPPLLATAFQERPGVKRRLEGALAPTGSTTVVTQVLAGDGGIGKTQLAVEAYEHAYTSGAYDLCLWATATSSEAIATWYARVMRRIDHEMAVGDPISAAQRFLTWLRETRNTWFIVLDDVADPADIEGWWPTGPNGRTLVTTRRRDASLSEHGQTVIDLEVFEPTEAQAYLASRLSTSQARPDALRGSGELANALGYLPLALSHACAVILDDGITCEEYWNRFIARTGTLIELFPASLGQRQRTVSATWSLAIEAADRLPPSGFSRPLLTLIAILDANGIPEDVLLTDAARTFVEGQRTSCTAPSPQGEAVSQAQPSGIEHHDALRALHRLSLIVHDPTDVRRAVRMHALAQRATREAVIPDTLRLAYKAAADALVQVWPTIERDSTLSNVLRQNAAALEDLAGATLWAPHAHPILFRAGHSMEEASLIGAALAYWRRMLSTSVRRLGLKHPDTLTIRREVGYCQGQAGDPTGAVTALEDLLADVLKRMGPSHRETLTVRRDLAWWRGETRDPAGAVAAYEELLNDMLRALGPNDLETLTTRYSLGRWRGQAGGPDPAIDDFRALLQDCLRLAGPDATLTLAVRHDLAWWLGESGDAAAAVAAFEALLPDREQILGPDHPYTLATRHDLAWWKWDAGDQDGAKSELETALADYLRVMGPNHPHTLAIREDLDFLLAGGRHSETHGLIRNTPGRVPGDLPGLDFLQPADPLVGWHPHL